MISNRNKFSRAQSVFDVYTGFGGVVVKTVWWPSYSAHRVTIRNGAGEEQTFDENRVKANK